MTDMMEFYSGLTFVVIGAAAILANMLLIGIVLGIQNRRRELNLSLALALVDSINPIIVITTTAYILISGKDEAQMQEACKIKGPIDFLIIFSSMLLSAIVARARCAAVVGHRVHILEKVTLSLYVSVYCFVVFIVGYYDEYQISPSGVDCAPDARLNARSASLVFLLGLSLFLFSCIALGSYTWIMIFIYRRHRHFDQLSKTNTTLIPRRNLNRPVILRTLATCSVYLLLSVPASILLMIESTIQLPETQFFSLAISVCVSLTPIANPCLVLFAHSIIYDQLVNSVARRF